MDFRRMANGIKLMETVTGLIGAQKTRIMIQRSYASLLCIVLRYR